MGDSTATGVATNITSNQLFITFHPVSPLIIYSRGHTSGMLRLETSSTGKADAFLYSLMMAHRIWSIMVIMHQSVSLSHHSEKIETLNVLFYLIAW